MHFVGSPMRGDEKVTLEIKWIEKQEYMFIK